MLKFAKYFYDNTRVGKKLITFIYDVHHYYRTHFITEEKFLKQEFKKQFGKDLNLDNPQTFNEKLNWLKLNDRTPLHTICSDKYKVRAYVKEKIGEEYLIPLLFETKDINDITPENLPNYPVIIKTNHDSSGGVIVRDKTEINWKSTRKRFRKLLKKNYYYSAKEWQYKNIEPRIVVEQLLTDASGAIPFDYKLHYFNGKLVFTQVDLDRQEDHKRNLYDKNWKLLDVQWLYKNGDKVERPKLFYKMIELGEVFAQNFCYIRVDFYHVNDKIYFGELTFHAEAGSAAFIPNHYDEDFGKLLKLHKAII